MGTAPEQAGQDPDRIAVSTFLIGCISVAFALTLAATGKLVVHVWRSAAALGGYSTYGPFEADMLERAVRDVAPLSHLEWRTDAPTRVRLLLFIGPSCGGCSEVTESWAEAIRDAGMAVDVDVVAVGRSSREPVTAARLAEVAVRYQVISISDKDAFSRRTGVYDFPVAVLWARSGGTCMALDRVETAGLKICTDAVRGEAGRLVVVWPAEGR